MSPLDIVFGIIIIAMAIRCAMKGFVDEFMTVAAVLGGIIGGLLLSSSVALLIESYVGPFYLSSLVGFLIVFIVIYLLAKIFENALLSLVDKINLENLDRALGLFLGIIEGMILVLFIILIMTVQPVFDTVAVLQESFIGSIGLKLIPVFQERIPQGDLGV